MAEFYKIQAVDAQSHIDAVAALRKKSARQFLIETAFSECLTMVG
jgi:hypothetical protein